MSITSLIFLFCFLPLALFFYYLAADSFKIYVLLAVNLLFYAIASRQYFFLLVFTAAAVVGIGRLMQRVRGGAGKKGLFLIGILLCCGILIYYKYTDFVLQTINDMTGSSIMLRGLILPLGLSFFTFKAISYLADLYTGKACPAPNPVQDLVYLTFFAQIQAGPLTRYGDRKAFCDPQGEAQVRSTLFSEGVYRFMIGFNKKILIANALVKVTDEIFKAPVAELSTGYAWLGAICYALQLFFDFAGYSDMAIGLSEMFGYRCMENFRYPYMTESVGRFWRRWHISLSQWFRDYIYIPLGGSRRGGRGRVYFNLFVVWCLTGLWHGAAWNFVLWGLGYFVMISLERILRLPDRFRTRAGRVFYRVFSLLFILFQWVLFRSENIADGLRYMKRMVVYAPGTLTGLRTEVLLKNYFWIILAAVIFCFPIVPYLKKKLEPHKNGSRLFEILVMAVTAALFVWALSFLVAGQNNPFAYANF